jgi:hypothetical protein
MSDLNARFKIDLTDSMYSCFGLFVRKPGGMGRTVWKEVACFGPREEVEAHYQKIKDLPEYLP